MTHRQIMEALSGLLLGMFVAILSSTIVSNALPEIIADLHGGQSAYTWVVTATLLAMTAATPLWGKLSDLFSKKLLVQIALLIYVAGSVVAGLSQNPGMLIACRVVQGVGVGGLSALAQVVMAAMISPRERGRYSGYLGATFAVATVGGPLLGGVITDTSWLGWRWCFYVGVPFAVIALIVLQKTLKLPVVKRDVKVDWSGAFFISAAVSLLLLWVTFAGDKYDWISWQTYAMVGGSIALGLIFILIESKAREPIIPLRLFRNKTITLASLASLFVGIAMFSGTVFFSQYFQLARGEIAHHVGRHDHPDDRWPVHLLDRLRSGHHQDRSLEGMAGHRWCAGDGGPRAAGHHPVRHPVLAHGDLHGAHGPRHRHDDAEPGAGHPEPGGPAGPRRGQCRRHLLPLPGRCGGRLGARCGARQPRHPLRQGRPVRPRPQGCRAGPRRQRRRWHPQHQGAAPSRSARSRRAPTATVSRTSSSSPPRPRCSASC
ncbi:Putative multidrug resistance protein MdtD [Streptomyces antimycoticus]